MSRICNSLFNAGYEVTLIGFLRKNSVAVPDQPYDQKRVKLCFRSGKLFYLEYNFKLFIHFLFSAYDVHSAVDLDTILASYLTTRIKRKRKLVLDAHELYLGLPEVERRPNVYRLWSRLEKWIYPKLKYAYTVNKSLANHYAETYGLDMKVVRNFPLKNTSSESSPKDKKPIVIYQGWLNEGRGLEYLIEAMQDVDAELWLVGEGELSDELRLLPEKFAVENKVAFKGYIEPEQLKKKTADAYIGVNLLEKRSLNYYLSLANKFFDYVQAGIPQLTMRYPEYVALNQENEVALLIERLDPLTISEALNRLIDDKEMYIRLSANIASAQQDWIWENEEGVLIDFYKQLNA